MLTRVLRVLTGLALCALTGCALIPPEPIVLGPTTAAPPAPAAPALRPNGSIYQPTAYGNYPLFEDRRPRNVGDIVTIVLEERTNAAKNVATNTSRTGAGSLAVTAAPSFMDGVINDKLNTGITGANTADGKGTSSANNTFTGTITTTVMGVLPNGNLQIAGEKQIAINRGSEYVRISGIVDPRSITGTNSVSSTRVADARIEYRSKGVMDEVQTMGWLQRFFLMASPF
ncbi:flagellar basal body L-ring protein [Bordetella genomosp. 1]|uniref:Flagellar L-ring protein n=1 Tax=Bordetella genomosp. 1 TaxID=1395607 RepID=A0A261S5Z7_9BORD|nr:flagellar basal body L-ring protein FlgH [Bordetella genomosp. 1]MDQ8032375.1 flagellar basal body L-ring protein FlgH [Bordetella sp.]OZI32605.1 flagellar basal body L-ring protein [Bordetella genomosp. 1]OZI66034.1 flagellar basal body L-ring protein [Bordetella genomosp. 1]